jgi:hypothetical protein
MPLCSASRDLCSNAFSFPYIIAYLRVLKGYVLNLMFLCGDGTAAVLM